MLSITLRWRSEEAGVSFAISPEFLLRRSGLVTLKLVQNGSHRRAVYPDATPRVHRPQEEYQIKKLLPVVSWIGFLASAISEYGFDIDFPLTPALWLMIAICAVVMATAHAAIGSRIHGIGKRETVSHLPGDVPSLSDAARTISTGSKSSWTSDRCLSIFQDSCRVADHGDIRVNSRGVIVTASDAIPAVIFLSPAVTRGPPWCDSQVTRTPGCSARLFCTAPLPSEIHFPRTSWPTIMSRTGEPA